MFPFFFKIISKKIIVSLLRILLLLTLSTHFILYNFPILMSQNRQSSLFCSSHTLCLKVSLHLVFALYNIHFYTIFAILILCSILLIFIIIKKNNNSWSLSTSLMEIHEPLFTEFLHLSPTEMWNTYFMESLVFYKY